VKKIIAKLKNFLTLMGLAFVDTFEMFALVGVICGFVWGAYLFLVYTESTLPVEYSLGIISFLGVWLVLFLGNLYNETKM
jgi:hypothetical protein